MIIQLYALALCFTLYLVLIFYITVGYAIKRLIKIVKEAYTEW